MNKVIRMMIICFLLFLPFFIYASGDSDSELKTIPIDLELTNIIEEEIFNDQSSGFFVFRVLGEGRIEGLGDFSYASMVAVEPSEQHSICGDGDLSSFGMGSTFLLFPGKGVLKLKITDCKQCVNLGTGQFRVTQTEMVTQGSGALKGTAGEWDLEVEGKMGSDQKIHITGKLILPL